MPSVKDAVAPEDFVPAWGTAPALAPVEDVPITTTNVDSKAEDSAPAETETAPDYSEHNVPADWCISDTVFPDGHPRILMYRSEPEPLPHTAEVHHTEASYWSQLGWNVKKKATV
jgi:hypothetical protein